MKGSFLILAALMAVAVSLPAETDMQLDEENKEEEGGKLNVITITQEEIEGEYHSPEGGIHFHCVVRGEYHFLSITTADGEPLVISKQPHNSTTLMSLSGAEFLVMKNPSESGQSKYSDYVVSNVYHKQVEKALKRDRFSSRLLQLLNADTNETRHNAIESLALRPEIELLMAASQALGDLGIIGSENPAAMPIYALTLRLEKYRDILLGGGEENMEENREGMQFPDEEDYRQKRACGSSCPYGSCPYYGYGSNCYGMCGPRCWCHSYFCGDCCVHRGCLDHDYCCGRYGYSSWSCITVWNIRCSSSYSC